MLRLTWVELQGLTGVPVHLEVGTTFETNLLDLISATYRVLEITRLGVKVERVGWTPPVPPD